jgi:uncharacterized protein YgbK (DUF1537 family)
MSRLLLTFYGDDFTGSTDALEQLSLAGVRTVLFIEPPTRAQLRQFPGLQAVGVAGMTRAMTPEAMEKVLPPALRRLNKLGAPHVHYKVCSTFDSSPKIGSIGCVIDLAVKIFHGPFVPLLVAAPALGRFTIFGTHFARFGIGSSGAVHRLDRHPSISHHPVTPMTEADLSRHLAKQTRKKIALFDILKLALPEKAARAALNQLLAKKPDVVLFDALSADHLVRIGKWMDEFASSRQPLFSVGSSGVDTALAAHFMQGAQRNGLKPVIKRDSKRSSPGGPLLVGSGSCSPVTAGQIDWATQHGFAEVPVSAFELASARDGEIAINRAVAKAVKILKSGRSVIVHTTRKGPDRAVAAKLKTRTAGLLGSALGRILLGALEQAAVGRLCLAGGDSSSHAARALGIQSVEMIAPLTPGAPLCRAHAPGSPADGLEIVFKGGQVGADDYFEIVRGKRI